MPRPRLIIVCGVPGAGKSTFARRVVERCDALSFASEKFAAELGPSARNKSGDLTGGAIEHAYGAMGAAIDASLRDSRLVLAVGSFRTEKQRKRFRDIAIEAGADAIAVRIACPVDLAAARVRERIAQGEHGPTEGTIGTIDSELTRASDVEIAIDNNATIDEFYRRADAALADILRS